jgi:methionyl-tRNA formyltransferase
MFRVVFLGTPQAAIPTLERLDESHDVGLVVTQPDRPKGRSKAPMPPPVKEFAANRGLIVVQPSNRQELEEAIQGSGPFDVGVVVAYGRILRPEILDAPRHGLLNVHFSLLPRWRGAAPVARALMTGDAMTGVTIIKLDAGLDTGPVLTAQAIDIPAEDNAGMLTERLADLGARLLVDVLPRYVSGEMQPVPQSDEGVTYAEKIDREDRHIDPDTDASSAVAKVRALAPSPAATLRIDGEPHKVYAARVTDARVGPGAWVAIDGAPVAGLGEGAIELITLQPPGRNPQSGSDWVNGRHSDRGRIA